MVMEEIALLVVPVLITIFVFALVKGWQEQKAKERADRVRLLEEALKNPSIDRTTLESLTYQLTGAKTPKKQGVGVLMSGLLGLGWMGLFVGIALWVIGSWQGDKDMTIGGAIASLAGFGMVTYPFALRELEARKVES